MLKAHVGGQVKASQSRNELLNLSLWMLRERSGSQDGSNFLFEIVEASSQRASHLERPKPLKHNQSPQIQIEYQSKW